MGNGVKLCEMVGNGGKYEWEMDGNEWEVGGNEWEVGGNEWE